jgi:hypothetical protein
VDHSVPVRVFESVGRLARDAERVLQRQLLLAGEPVAELLALDERHREPELPACAARIVDRQDVRVLEPRGEPDLALKALGAEGVSEIGVKDLEGDRAVVADVVGEIYRGHAAAAELALDRVAGAECRREIRT